MLLEGVIRHLPRPRFHVTVCALGGQPSRRLEVGADRVVSVPKTVAGARQALVELRQVCRDRYRVLLVYEDKILKLILYLDILNA